jgi:hypothetical protein
MSHETKFASALMAYFHDDLHQITSEISQATKTTEGRENPQVDEPDKCLFYNMSNLRTSDGETEDARYEFGHLIEPALLPTAARSKPDCSSLTGKSQHYSELT